ncbi:MAG: namA [Segetibacter sp.]|nr:namA [Segetibacter sp.]
MSNLFSPLTIRTIQFHNRIVVSPMCQYSSTEGFATDWHLVHLGSRAIGGAALIIAEATAVSPEGRISPSDLGIWKDEHIEPLQRITKFLKEHGSVAGIQLAHAGRKASTKKPWEGNGLVTPEEGGWKTFAPSAIAFSNDYDTPLEMSINDIKRVIEDFRKATTRSITAGYEVIEIHAAHGYLINQFLSPLSNHRTDDYGGSFENRIRLLLEIIEATQTAWPTELPLFVRISATDWADEEGGWTLTDSLKLARILKGKGIDLIDSSTGGNLPTAKIPVGPGYQVPFAEAIRKETGILTGAVGMILTATQAEEIITAGQADMVIMAREMLRDPYFPLHAAKELGVDIKWPVQYERAKRK